MGIPHIILEAGGVYHIYNHAVGSENIFKEDENYLFFLRKFSTRITPFTEVLAFCLMPNHFHFVLRIKDKKDLVALWKEKLPRVKAKRERKNSSETLDHILLDELIINEFGSLFNSYVHAFNKKYSRRGSLLKESFQRKIVDSDIGLIKLISYVHNNPVEHGFTSCREDWKYSSYNAILSEKKTIILGMRC
jgi:putative transposase